MDTTHSIPDATDWLDTPLKGLADLENALHCQICKEFYDTPMITSCNHTFCSRCIRTSLSADGRCPACRASDQANKLRNNWAIQEVVAAFNAARPEALEVARKSRDDALRPSNPRKRKRDADIEVTASTRTTRSKTRRIASSQTSQPEPIEVDDESDSVSEFEPEQPPPQPNDGLYECPLGCGKRMKEEAIFPHLDHCEKEKAQSRQAPKVNGGISKVSTARPQDRISELNYSMMKEVAITRKLQELGIPTWGGKPVMTNRHREWVNIWNANCDSNHPRSKRELLKDLDNWERTQGGNAPRQNSNIMRKDFDAAGWANKNKDDFSRLIADARRKKNVTPPTSEQKEAPSIIAESSPSEKPPDPNPTLSTKSTAMSQDQSPATKPGPTDNTDDIPSIFHSNATPTPATLQSSKSTVEQTSTQQKSPKNRHSSEPCTRPLPADYSPSQDEHTARRNTGAQCELPAHLQDSRGVKKVPMFAVPEKSMEERGGDGEVVR